LAGVPAQAALITTDSRFGADTLVYDTATNLDWLILPLTAGMSVSEVVDAVQPAGAFTEFRLAMRDELVTLLGSLGLPINGTCFGTCFSNAQTFVDVFQGNSGLMGPIAVVDFMDPLTVELFGYQASLYPSPPEVFGDMQLLTRSFNTANSGDHFFLVTETSVPTPGTLSLLAMGLGGLLLIVRRRNPAHKPKDIGQLNGVREEPLLH
jgi:hypothetical protein